MMHEQLTQDNPCCIVLAISERIDQNTAPVHYVWVGKFHETNIEERRRDESK